MPVTSQQAESAKVLPLIELGPPFSGELYPKQLEAIYSPARYAVIEASTKAGKTHGCIKWLFDEAMSGTAGSNFWWIAPVFGQSRIAFRRFLRALPRFGRRLAVNRSELYIELPNGCLIWFKSADNPDSLYGDDVCAVVFDEAPRAKEEAWHAVRSTLTATNGRARIIGNVKGRRNWAYHLARKAEAGEPDWSYARLTAYDAVQAGVLSAAEIDDARRMLPEHVFNELYLAQASDDGGNPFGIDAIRACIAPQSTGEPVVAGVDLAKKVDWTVEIQLDSIGAVCGFWRYQRSWKDTVQSVINHCYCVDTYVDATGVGDPIVEELQRSSEKFVGVKFTASRKQQLMEGLALAIQQRRISYPDGPIVQELESMEYQYTRTGAQYGVPEGMHDDCVMALALAVSGHNASRTGVQEWSW